MKNINKIGEKCTGCGACKNICPMKCIDMVQNKEGFIYPKINFDICKNCGLCEKVCPANRNFVNLSTNDCYYGYSINKKIRMMSSSGGIFYELAKSVIDKGGLVCGVGYDENQKVIHKIVSKINDLYDLMGSKYVQSDTLYTYQEILKHLKNSTSVLFSGTPCQIAGLKLFLKKDFGNLYTISFICHGVPSIKVYNKYLNEMKKKYHSDIEKINFRDKKKVGWNHYSLKIVFSNGKKYNKTLRNDVYLKTYLSNNTLRESCYDCKFKCNYSNADITIGDFWGIEKYETINDAKFGISLILINTKKGKEILNDIRSQIFLKSIDYKILMKENKSYLTSVKKGTNRHKYFEKIDQYSVKKLYRKNCKSKNILINFKKELYLFLKEKGVIK